MKIDDIIDNTKHYIRNLIESKYFRINIEPYLDTENPETIPFMYHGGTFGKKREDISIIEIKERKKSQSTPPIYHNVLNKFSEERFNVPIRNFFFTSTSRETAEAYGSPYVIIPLDDYSLFYHEDIEDMYADINFNNSVIKNKVKNNLEDVISKKADKLLEKVDRLIGENKKDFLRSKFYEIISNTSNYGKLEIFSKIVREDYETLDQWGDKIKSQNIVMSFRELIIDILYGTYGMDSIIDSDNYDEIVELCWFLALEVLSGIYKITDNHINGLAEKYISGVKKTDNISDVPGDNEIMLTPGKCLLVKDIDLLFQLIKKELE